VRIVIFLWYSVDMKPRTDAQIVKIFQKKVSKMLDKEDPQDLFSFVRIIMRVIPAIYWLGYNDALEVQDGNRESYH